MVINPIPESNAMVRKSCQNSTLGSIARPLISGVCESWPTSPTSDRVASSSSSLLKEPLDGFDTCFEDTRDEVSSWSGFWGCVWGFDTVDNDLACTGGCDSKALVLCVPASSSSALWRKSVDLVLCSLVDSTGLDGCKIGKYGSLGGKIRSIGIETRFKIDVPRANNNKNRPVSSLKMSVETVDQKKALRPNAAKGNAVAVPRWSGKFDAAIFRLSYLMQLTEVRRNTCLYGCWKSRAASKTSKKSKEAQKSNSEWAFPVLVRCLVKGQVSANTEDNWNIDAHRDRWDSILWPRSLLPVVLWFADL